jgi:quercetin dioxygenase-like cupin family protein
MPSIKRQQHTYLRTHRIAGNILSVDIGAEEIGLRGQAQAAKSGRAAKTLVKEGKLRVTLIALRAGTVLGAHHVEGEVTLHVLRGQFEVLTGDGTLRASKGGLIALGAGVSHEARAVRDSTVLITTSMR